MADKAGGIGFCGLPLFRILEQFAAVYQMAEKGVRIFDMGDRADIMSADCIRRKEIEENIRTLQPKAECSVVLPYHLFQRAGRKHMVSVQPE